MVFLGSIAQQLGEFQFVMNFLSSALPAFLWGAIPGRLVVLCGQCFYECYYLYLLLLTGCQWIHGNSTAIQYPLFG